MRPIDYAIKLIVAYNMGTDLFHDLADSLYYEDTLYVSEVMNCLKENDPDVVCAVENVFHQTDYQL